MSDRIKTGSKGEKLACEFLENKGYKILEKNWRSGRYDKEIMFDIVSIMIKGNIQKIYHIEDAIA